MHQLFVLALVALAACLQQQVQAEQPRSLSAYLIRGKLIRSAPEAVTQLRHFVSKRQSKIERCQRLAVLLDTINGNNVDSFQIAELALARFEQFGSKYKRIDVEGLRNLYINAINSFIEARRIDAGFLELVECLSDKFRATDAKARSYLNDAQLKAIVEQYKLIDSQPLETFMDPANHKVADLEVDQLNPLVAETYAELRALQTPEAKHEQSVVAPLAVAAAKADGENDATQAAAAHATPAVVPEDVDAAVTNKPTPEPTPGPTPEAAPEQVPQPEASGEVEPEPIAPGEELDEESVRYFVQMFGAITQVYNSLPLSAMLGDRCQAYSFVINASEADLSQEAYIKGIVQGADEHIKLAGANKAVVLRDETDRENFLFAASYAHQFLADVDPEALSDLQECANHLREETPQQ